MINLSEIKITPRDEQVLKLLVQGCSNKEIATQLNISPRTVKQHLRTLFLRAGIRFSEIPAYLSTAPTIWLRPAFFPKKLRERQPFPSGYRHRADGAQMSHQFMTPPCQDI